MEIFFESLNFPTNTIVSKKLDKKEFLDNFSLNINDRKLLSQGIDRITLENILNQNTINISPFIDENKDYSEIALIKVKISNKEKLKSINNIIQQIPYSLIVFYIFENELCLCLSPKRINKSDSSKLVVEEVHFSRWIDFENLTNIDKTFLQSLNINNHPFTNLLAFYESYIDKLISYNASIYSGNFLISKDTKQILENIQKIEAQIIEIKNKMKKETNFNEKVNMNMELKILNDKLKDLKEDLK
ncbi:DUF4391 domain-containing protein [Aliarcobacter butzleri]|uniref:DUF4391 domain-containing protein n=1 Tax=Aliarcobacter butzleri TaxID=28197 RepID=UPI00263D163E|nr:DUF4391 domain-containing protein [Aliarcobacter butzleri]MDN5060713.1 DUF4391 domain-containing protein [Aliarcobacter butzleri]